MPWMNAPKRMARVKNFLSILSSLPGHIRLMFTSRQNIQLDTPIRLDIHAADDDIRDFVESQILSLGKLVHLINKEPDLHEFLVNQVVSQAKGM